MKVNPYPEEIQDEASGIMVRNIKHKVWEEGYKACSVESTIVTESKIKEILRPQARKIVLGYVHNLNSVGQEIEKVLSNWTNQILALPLKAEEANTQ